MTSLFWQHLLTALIVAAGLSAVFIAAFRRRGFEQAAVFFTVVFLGAWAGGIWLPPLGPQLGGVSWLSFLIVGLVFALVLAAAVPSFPPGTTVQLLKEGEKSGETKKSLVLGVYFWTLVMVLMILIVGRYF